jgi:hypothetical protein
MLPTLDKTWTFSVNNVVGNYAASYEDAKDFVYKLKVMLLSFGWTVRSSSNGAGAFGNEDGVDHVSSAANVVFGTGNHTWIVLRNTGLAANAAICIDCYDPGWGGNWRVYFSSTGFSLANGGVNGSATTCPTGAAATSWTVIADNSMHPLASFKATLHGMASTDGQCTRIICTYRAIGRPVTGYLAIERVKNPVSEWTVPIITHGINNTNISNGGGLYSTYLYNGANTGGKNGGTALSLYLTGETRFGVALMDDTSIPLCDDAGVGWPMPSVGIACTTVGHRNWRKGEMYDMWWASYMQLTGTSYPETAGQKRKFMQFHRMILPWNGLVTPDGTPIDLG